MEVVTDAVPSPSRPEQEQASAEPQLQPQPQPQPQPKEQDRGTPDSGQENQTKCPEGREESESKPCNRSSSTRQEYTKTQKKKPSSSRLIKQVQNNYNISGCTDVTVGTVTNYYYAIPKDGMQMKEGEPRVPKVLRILRNSKNPVTERDIVIVSESVDMDGLEILAKELGIEQVELNKIKHNYKDKGLKEIAFRTLELWCDISNSGENQSAMLNILCEKVYKIYNNGGKKALKTLCKVHFPSTEFN